ncbi:B3 domain-containing protein-like [Forsythia ovata]|uniref:B3 domain-containing protein-like n=1 Tax=Forsythia ovata TaxID=205694 RepID=A0ABD1TR51_9LAMI
MVHDGKACQECSRNCMLMHQKQKNASPAVTRFFKLMFGDDYLNVLYLPAYFVRQVPNAIDQQSCQEDVTGQRWPVTASTVDGYWAIQKGWHKFAVDHRLEIGEFLVFSYIEGGHFDVKIYGRSGCERMNFNRRRGRPRKRSREEEETIVLEEPCQPLKRNPRGKPRSSTSVASGSEFQHGQRLSKEPTASNPGIDFGKRQFCPTTISTDNPVLLLNTNAGNSQREDRTYLLDLSIYEMGRNESNPDKIKKSSLGGEIVPDHSQLRKQAESTDNDIQMAENEEDHMHLTKSAENSNMSKGTPNVPSTYPSDKRNNAVLDNEALSLGSSQISGSEGAVTPKYSGCSVSVPMVKDPSGKEPKMAIKCTPIPLRAVKDINRIVKTARDMHSALVRSDAPFLAKVKCQSYLEFLISLWPIEGKDKGEDTQVTFLRDSIGRLWPVAHYSDTLGVTAYVDGWKQFCEENNIQPGDICEFKRENSICRSYGINVIGKSVG